MVLSGDAAADEAQARRLIDAAAPDRSPLVVKASGEMHGGGSVISVGDASYRALVAWAAEPVAPVAVPAPASLLAGFIGAARARRGSSTDRPPA